MANPLLDFGNKLTNIAQSGLDRASNIFYNQAPNRLLDYTTNIGITGVPFVGDINIPLEGRTKPVTNLSEIAPTKSTRNVIAEGIMSNINRKNLDFDKPFSSVIQSKGGGGEYALDRPIDYSGYKLGNPLPGAKNLAKEVGQVWNTMLGDPSNQIANTLGDYTVNYTPKLDPNHPEVMSIYDHYDFVGKAGEGRGSPYDININLPPEMIEQIKEMSSNKRAQQFKQQQFMNKKKQDMQRRIRKAEKKQRQIREAEEKRIEQEKIKTAQNNWKPTYNPASSHAEAQATGGDYHSGNLSTVDGKTTDWGPMSHMIARGGLAQYAPRGSYFNGGLASLYRHGGF